jgi:hypothetical protein
LRLTDYKMRNGEVVETAYACERNPRDLEECFGTSEPGELRTVLRRLRDEGWLIVSGPGHPQCQGAVGGGLRIERMYVVRDCSRPGEVRDLCRRLRYDGGEDKPRRVRVFTY